MKEWFSAVGETSSTELQLESLTQTSVSAAFTSGP